MVKTLNMFSFIGGSGEAVLNPIYEALTLIGPYALSVVLVLSIFYGIFLGVKYAQAEDEATKASEYAKDFNQLYYWCCCCLDFACGSLCYS